MSKSRDAFRTISEVAEWLDTPAHVLRFWESKFTQVKPVKRAGGRRYYRPADMQLLSGIKKLLHEDGLTIKGAQKTLREKGVKYVASLSDRSSLEDIEMEAAAPIESAPYVEAPMPDAEDETTVIPFETEDQASGGDVAEEETNDDVSDDVSGSDIDEAIDAEDDVETALEPSTPEVLNQSDQDTDIVDATAEGTNDALEEVVLQPSDEASDETTSPFEAEAADDDVAPLIDEAPLDQAPEETAPEISEAGPEETLEIEASSDGDTSSPEPDEAEDTVEISEETISEASEQGTLLDLLGIVEPSVSETETPDETEDHSTQPPPDAEFATDEETEDPQETVVAPVEDMETEAVETVDKDGLDDATDSEDNDDEFVALIPEDETPAQPSIPAEVDFAALPEGHGPLHLVAEALQAHTVDRATIQSHLEQLAPLAGLSSPSHLN